MKRVLYLLVMACLTMALSACADRPSKEDIDRAIKGLPLDGLTVLKTEEAGKDRNGVYTIGMWGVAKDNGEEMNIYSVLQFEKKDGKWEGFVPIYGLVAQPVKEKDKDAFYADTSKDWEKLKAGIGR